MDASENSDLQRQIDELTALVARNHHDIDALRSRADISEGRADSAEERADKAQVRADEIEARAIVDREMIAELQADGALSREHVHHLEAALATSRVIGAAIGILMERRRLDQADALTVLKEASQRSNIKLRDMAEIIVAEAVARK